MKLDLITSTPKTFTLHRPISQREKLVNNGRFQNLNSYYWFKVGWIWLRFDKVLVTRYVPAHHQFFAFGSFILVFRIPAIIHQQVVEMLRGHMRFVFKPYAVRREGVQYKERSNYCVCDSPGTVSSLNSSCEQNSIHG